MTFSVTHVYFCILYISGHMHTSSYSFLQLAGCKNYSIIAIRYTWLVVYTFTMHVHKNACMIEDIYSFCAEICSVATQITPYGQMILN